MTNEQKAAMQRRNQICKRLVFQVVCALILLRLFYHYTLEQSSALPSDRGAMTAEVGLMIDVTPPAEVEPKNCYCYTCYDKYSDKILTSCDPNFWAIHDRNFETFKVKVSCK